ncbi:acetyl-CoA synthetase-like protein [Ascobolus immersus RN42]|uniref:Acetyl-CoA synthetase-like protein n=1 Tax=Ascobolus immersus RN42 TaxID=1160509 RepID=A0A3N4IQ81_ASCIM|nr:acetyl-CoA synthetase-like protein [Ascobolus immersus RN42]
MAFGTSQLLRSSRPLRANFCRAPLTHRTLSTLPKLPLFEALVSHDPNSIAIRHVESGKKFTYGDLLQQTVFMKEKLLNDAGRDSLDGARVTTLVNNGFQFASTVLGIWAAGGVAVPYQTAFPAKEIRYITRDTKPEFSVFGVEDWKSKQEKVQEGNSGKCVKSLIGVQTPTPGIVDTTETIELEDSVKPTDPALIIYTSGTTNLPKGVVSLHKTILAQATGLQKAWNITKNDHLLHVLPLHHVHGVMAGTVLPLLAGAQISYAYPFNAEKIWNRLCNLEYQKGLSPAADSSQINLFMGVPTIYNRLLEVFHKYPERQSDYTSAASKLRLAISGSSALPASVKKAWEKISDGQVILERYGMTEIGLVLSCGLPVETRIDNSVGKPVPGYTVRLGSLDRSSVVEGADVPGEIQVKGEGVFDHYWDRPAEVTDKEFTEDGFFCTGDIAHRDSDGNYYIQGRKNIDLIISGGENVSALEVEATILRLFPDVKEVAIVGLPDERWGEIVAAIVHYDKDYLKAHPELKGLSLRERLKDSGELAAHKLPVKTTVSKEMFTRNAMGKINKKKLKEEFFSNVLGEYEARERKRKEEAEKGEGN